MKRHPRRPFLSLLLHVLLALLFACWLGLLGALAVRPRQTPKVAAEVSPGSAAAAAACEALAGVAHRAGH